MIDWAFIGSLEGRQLQGYVPRNADGSVVGHSGVTIATGCDLGWLTPRERLAMPNLCPGRFAPYYGITGEAAAEFLKAHPISISAVDADGVDAVMDEDILSPLRSFYVRDSAVAFTSLPDRAETVIFSFAYQHGPHFKLKYPHYWALCIARDYKGMYDCLMNFGDVYPTRRHKEAAYLLPILS